MEPRERGGLPALRQRLTSVITPVTRAAGVDLEAVEVARIGRRHRVQVIIDADGGVGVDAIAEVSRAVSRALDRAEESGGAVFPGEYVLEVSSPGVDRPLTEPRHWRRNLGRLVTVPGPDGKRLTGRVADATGDRVVLELAAGRRELAYAELGPGRVQVELQPDATGDDRGVPGAGDPGGGG